LSSPCGRDQQDIPFDSPVFNHQRQRQLQFGDPPIRQPQFGTSSTRQPQYGGPTTGSGGNEGATAPTHGANSQVPPSGTRREVHEGILAGRRVVRPERQTSSNFFSEIEADSYDTLATLLDRAGRWYHFLHHSNIAITQVIDKVCDGKYSCDHDIYRRLRIKALDNNKTYKNKVLEQTLVYLHPTEVASA